jgi:hypothetical protein
MCKVRLHRDSAHDAANSLVLCWNTDYTLEDASNLVIDAVLQNDRFVEIKLPSSECWFYQLDLSFKNSC